MAGPPDYRKSQHPWTMTNSSGNTLKCFEHRCANNDLVRNYCSYGEYPQPCSICGCDFGVTYTSASSSSSAAVTCTSSSSSFTPTMIDSASTYDYTISPTIGSADIITGTDTSIKYEKCKLCDAPISGDMKKCDWKTCCKCHYHEKKNKKNS